MLGKLILYGVPIGLSTVALYKYMTSQVFNREDVLCEPPFTSIVMCSLNEEAFIERTLKSLDEQNVFMEKTDRFECLLIDSHSSDRTVEIAEDYGWTAIDAPRGKLTSRHIGMERAKGEVIISVDADTIYPPNWLNLILKWFGRRDVVGVITPRLVDPEENMLVSYASVWMSLIDTGPLLIGGMRAPGQSMAMYKQAYFDTGGFDLNINQQNVHEMVREEEVKFAMKLRRLGSVPVEWRAPCFTSLRRLMIVKKNDKSYEKWRQERFDGERF